MKRKCTALFVIILIGLLTACSSSSDDNADDSETRDTFTGIIATIEGQNAIVDIKDGAILKSGRKVSVNLSVADDTTFQVGDEVRVGYEGEVRESGPLGIDTTLVELISRDEGKNNKIETDNPNFTGTIKEINGNSALVYAKIFEDNPEGDVFVDLSVNNDETFQVGDKVKIEYDGTIMESSPAQINTLSVELIE